MDDSRIPSDFSPPFATVTANDRTGWVIITTVLGLIYSLLFGLATVVVSWTTGPGRLQVDGVALAIPTVRELIQYLTIFNLLVLACRHSAMLCYPRGMFRRL